MTYLECRSLVKNFVHPDVSVLKSITFTVKRNEFIGITGRSGSGKSTLLYALGGLDRPTSGDVIIDGRKIYDLPDEEMNLFRNTKMGFVFQFHYLLPELNSLENVLMPARKMKRERELKERALDLLERFNLSHCVYKRPSQMSGGEQQRVAVARALVMDPDVLYADEPTGNLDSVNGKLIMDLFVEINRDHGTTILLVTHEPDYAAMAGRQIHLKDGMIETDRNRPVKRKGRS